MVGHGRYGTGVHLDDNKGASQTVEIFSIRLIHFVIDSPILKTKHHSFKRTMT